MPRCSFAVFDNKNKPAHSLTDTKEPASQRMRRVNFGIHCTNIKICANLRTICVSVSRLQTYLALIPEALASLPLLANQERSVTNTSSSFVSTIAGTEKFRSVNKNDLIKYNCVIIFKC